MNPTLLVARRELRERTRRAGFWILLVVSVLAMVALVVAPRLISHREAVRVGVIGPRTSIDHGIEGAARAIGVTAQLVAIADDATLERELRAERLNVGIDSEGRLVVRTVIRPGDSGDTARLVVAMSETLRLQRGLERSGLSPDASRAVLSAPGPAIRTLVKTQTEQTGRQGTALVANILLFAMLQIYGAWVLTGVTEEKSSRVAEVLLASLRPRELLVGKVLGIGVVALAHAMLLVAAAVAAGVATGASFLDQVDLAALPAAVAWLMLGFAFYCMAYGAAGSMVSRAEDAQSMAFPVMLPVLATYLIGFGVIFSGSVPVVYHVLAWLPPTAPVAMSVLQLGGRVPWWEAAGSAALCVAGIVAMGRLAARIYEGSILRGGRRVSLRTALGPRELS